VDVDGRSLVDDLQPNSVSLAEGSAATWNGVCIRQMNRVNSHNGYGHNDSSINTGNGIIIIFLQ